MKYPEIRTLFDRPAIDQKVFALGRRLEEGAGDDLLIISLIGGSVVFLADLVRAIRHPTRYDFIQVGYSTRGEEIRDIQFPLPMDVTGQRLVLLKDVVHSGVTELFLQNELRARGAAEIRFVALIDLPDERKTDFEPDFRVFAAERPGIFVGYGLKHEGRYGNLPFIGRLMQRDRESEPQS